MPRINFRDTRAIYVMFFAIVMISSIAPIALPLPIAAWSRDFYNTINTGVTVSFPGIPPRVFAGVKKGTNVFIVNSGEIGKLWGDMSESVTLVWRDLINRGANILLWSASTDAQATIDKYIVPLFYPAGQSDPLYGSKFVDLGYVAGGNGLLEQWKDSVKAITPADRYGTPLTSLPMMTNFDVLGSQADLIIGLDARALETIFVVRYNTPVIEISGSGASSYLGLSYSGGYFKGMLYGQLGGAQYQLLSGLPGHALSYAQNMLTLSAVMIVLMIAFNVKYRMDLGKKPLPEKELVK
jgi:hypothetical protein